MGSLGRRRNGVGAGDGISADTRPDGLAVGCSTGGGTEAVNMRPSEETVDLVVKRRLGPGICLAVGPAGNTLVEPQAADGA